MSDKKLSFEEAYTALEKIAEKLGSNEISLDEAVKLYEEGMHLSKYCAQTLENAKQKIETLKNEGK
jgi:exodeoxyribonuclease VII small subunit